MYVRKERGESVGNAGKISRISVKRVMEKFGVRFENITWTRYFELYFRGG